MNEIFALVYTDYEGLNILELGDKEFIWKKYKEYIKGLEEYKEKFKDFESADFANLPEELRKLYRETDFDYQDDPKRYCIRGYKDEKIHCLCQDFGIGLDEPIFY